MTINNNVLNYFNAILQVSGSYKEKLELKLKELRSKEEDHAISSLFLDFVWFGTPDIDDIRNARHVACELSPNAWMWYCSKKDDGHKEKIYGENPDVYFGTECHNEVLKQLSALRKTSPDTRPSLNDIYSSFATKRSEIAKMTQSLDAEKFGSFRKGSGLFSTPIVNAIQHYHDKSKQKFMDAIKGKDPLAVHPLGGVKFLENEERYQVYSLSETADEPDHQYVVTCKSGEASEELAYFLSTETVEEDGNLLKPILNRIIYSQYGSLVHLRNCSREEIAIGYFDTMTNQGNCKSLIFHGPSKNVPRFWKNAEAIFKQIVALPQNFQSKKSCDLIAELHWLLANIMATERGNAAIVDMLTTTLLLYFGFYVSPYKQGIMGDMEALTSTKNEFINNFSNFRQIPFNFSIIEQKLILNCGNKFFTGISEFPYDHSKHCGISEYLSIPKSDIPNDVMKGIDKFGRRFILLKDENLHAHIFFQRYTNGSLWVYRRGDHVETLTNHFSHKILN